VLDHKKLSRIKELIEQKEAVEGELSQLLGDAAAAPKRGRPAKEKGGAEAPPIPPAGDH
jgi:hypothetical protein